MPGLGERMPISSRPRAFDIESIFVALRAAMWAIEVATLASQRTPNILLELQHITSPSSFQNSIDPHMSPCTALVAKNTLRV